MAAYPWPGIKHVFNTGPDFQPRRFIDYGSVHFELGPEAVRVLLSWHQLNHKVCLGFYRGLVGRSTWQESGLNAF